MLTGKLLKSYDAPMRVAKTLQGGISKLPQASKSLGATDRFRSVGASSGGWVLTALEQLSQCAYSIPTCIDSASS